MSVVAGAEQPEGRDPGRRRHVHQPGIVADVERATAQAGSHHPQSAVQKGILLVAFGTSVPEARVAFDNIESKVKEAFPAAPVRWAYTSHIIRKKLAKEGRQLDSVAMALARMMDEGFTHVAVQSLHTIRGKEFEELVHTARAFETMPGGFTRVMVGEPLLSSQADMEKVAAAIIANIPAGCKKEDAVVLMGHGTHHPANAFYAALMYHLQRRDPRVFIGTVEGAPGIEEIAEMLTTKGAQKAYLMPFMSVAGDHARNDMAGDGPDSWKSILARAGVKSEIILKGTAEYDNFTDVWLHHLREAVDRLDK
jgi:sirohydrochlorin cobaltochelatase